MQAIFWVRKKCSLSAVFFCPFPVNFVIALTQPLTAKAFFGVFLQLLTLQYNYAASGHYVDKSRTNCSDHFPTKACNISIWVLAWSPFSSARSSSGAIVGGVGGGKRDPLRAKYTLGSTYYGHLVLRLGIFFSFVPKKAVLEEDMLDSSWGMAPPASSIRVDQLMRKQSTIVPRLLLSVVMLLNISWWSAGLSLISVFKLHCHGSSDRGRTSFSSSATASSATFARCSTGALGFRD